MYAYWIISLGAFFIWIFKGFKGTYRYCKKNKHSGTVGVLVIMLFVLILYLI